MAVNMVPSTAAGVYQGEMFSIAESQLAPQNTVPYPQLHTDTAADWELPEADTGDEPKPDVFCSHGTCRNRNKTGETMCGIHLYRARQAADIVDAITDVQE
jgi:hypothetical protein